MKYDAFISYSHSADGRLAPAVQTGLQRLAKPWYRRRALRVFRDETGLSVNPHLWSSIAEAMDQARYFVLLASPEAAASPWVNREITQWLQTHPPETLLPVLTDGTLVWSETLGDFDPKQSSAFPPALGGVYGDEPRHLDLRWAQHETQLDLRHSEFRAQIATLAAPIHGVAREDLEGEDVRLHRRAMRLAGAAGVGLVALTVAALIASFVAVGYADAARHNEARAQRNFREVTVQRARALDNAREAKAQETKANENAAQAAKSEVEAELQATRARTNAAEAEKNADEAAAYAAQAQANAGRAAANAAQAERNATQATQLAEDLTGANVQLRCATGELGKGIMGLRGVLLSAKVGLLTPRPLPAPLQDPVEHLEATIRWLEAQSGYRFGALQSIAKLAQTEAFSSPCGISIEQTVPVPSVSAPDPTTSQPLPPPPPAPSPATGPPIVGSVTGLSAIRAGP